MLCSAQTNANATHQPCEFRVRYKRLNRKLTGGAEMTAAEVLKAEATPRTAAADIHRFIREALAKVGLPETDAETVAALMTRADVTGADAHGVFRLPQYVARIEEGGVAKRPNITVTRNAPATALVDGDNGMGHLVMSRVGRHRHRHRCRDRRRLGRRPPLEPRRPGGALCREAGRPRHGRHLFGRRQRQPHADLGRLRNRFSAPTRSPTAFPPARSRRSSSTSPPASPHTAR